MEFFLKLHIIPGRIFPSIFLPFSNWEKVEKTKRKLFFKCFFLLIIFLVLSEREIAKKIYGISSEFFSSFSHLILIGKREENNENGKYFFLSIFIGVSRSEKARNFSGKFRIVFWDVNLIKLNIKTYHWSKFLCAIKCLLQLLYKDWCLKILLSFLKQLFYEDWRFPTRFYQFFLNK